MNYLYVSIISVVSSVIVYLIFKFKSNSSISNETKVEIESKKEIKIESNSSSTSEIKIDGEKIEKNLKKSYDEMVGRL